jgi:hypothetical protein
MYYHKLLLDAFTWIESRHSGIELDLDYLRSLKKQYMQCDTTGIMHIIYSQKELSADIIDHVNKMLSGSNPVWVKGLCKVDMVSLEDGSEYTCVWGERLIEKDDEIVNIDFIALKFNSR